MKFLFVAYNLATPKWHYAVRVLSYAKYLSSLGHTIDFVTGSHGSVLPYRWATASYSDIALSRARIGTTPAFFNVACAPFMYLPTIPSLVDHIVRQCEVGQYDALFTSSLPLVPSIAASMASRRTGVPHIVEFRDPISDNPIWRWRSYLHFLAQKIAVSSILSNASAVIYNTVAARDSALREYSLLDPTLTHAIPHGLDPNNVLSVGGERSSPVFTVGFSGTFYDLHTRRHTYNPFTYSRSRHLLRYIANSSPLFLLRAFSLLRSSGRLPSTARLLFVGASPRLSRLVSQFGLADCATLRGRMDQRALYPILAPCSVLYLPNVMVPSPSPYIASKTMDYIASRVPFIYSLPDGENAGIARASGLGIPTPPEDHEALAATIAAFYNTYFVGGTRPAPCDAYISLLSYEALARDFETIAAGVLDGTRRSVISSALLQVLPSPPAVGTSL